MRGVVTLAAAFAIPEEFDYRETLILTALVVAAGTLFVQGSTLPWLVRRLRLPAPDPREDALARAALFEKASAAGLERLELHHDDDDPFNTVQALRDRAAQRNTAAWERLGGTNPDEETPERGLRPAAAGDARRRAGQGAARAQHRHDPARGGRGRARRRSTSRSRCSTSATTGARSSRAPRRSAASPARSRACEHLRRRAARRRLAGRAASARTACADGLHPVGAPAQVPGVRAHGLLRLLAAAARQRALRARPATR